ncbi:MAG: DUF1634 domain-containing protein [Bacteroidota bacterium]
MTSQKQNHDRWIAWTLKIGMWLSACLLLTGVTLSYATPAETSPGNLLNMAEFLTSMMRSQLPLGEAFLYAGIMTLMFTPVLRVGAAVITFIAERDWRFVGVSVAVFVVLLLEVILSLQ